MAIVTFDSLIRCQPRIMIISLTFWHLSHSMYRASRIQFLRQYILNRTLCIRAQMWQPQYHQLSLACGVSHVQG